jgi:large subunit ribosomal protein L29
MAAKKKVAKKAAAAPKRAAKPKAEGKKSQAKGAGNVAADALRAKNAAELNDELLKLRKEQFALRLQRATGQAVKPDQFGKVRKNIARLKTIAREAQLKSAGVSK